ncbi:N-acetylglucosamine-6-phosphate deacetylase [Calidifontibacter sp. DB0510]|uniref:N-acetylglucosamine-6-phosphate deacetylase n=1 Tax=Metallococcus carri TaxID=1656884 RepID=A0A967EG37_9MICO|nr:N-acetylglucosamine-6-phosphate deacetylase [Metallococcus carri]NHN57196.1 N-acetylglucosamine-6-phosphate deacetylase [Metallococcus carri]NOP38001.1 N-acetylglucosamine-6-phosphate deacetylase [Calidifontibacter sp. DB2511S]
MSRIVNGRLVTPAGVLDGGTVETDGGRITAVDPGPADRRLDDLDVDGSWVLPGFIDLHVHGGGGHDMGASADDLRAAVAFHQAHGTTRTLVSLVTAPVDLLERQLADVAQLVGEPGVQVIGSHLEGPFLSEIRCGAQNPAYLIEPDREVFERLAAAADGTLRVLTIAPELPHALEVIQACCDAKVVVALGHSDATYDEAWRAIDAGAGLATHLFNGMRPVHHREPGLVSALLESHLPCELVNDGVHLHPGIVRLAAEDPSRPVFITDAIDATGMGDGAYELGGQQVRVRNGQARLVSNDALAGSTLTMDAAVRRAVANGIPIERASAAASQNPARVLGMDDQVGRIAPGLAADLVVLDGDLRVQRVMVAGQWVQDPPAPD